jgi:hypothetical protein
MRTGNGKAAWISVVVIAVIAAGGCDNRAARISDAAAARPPASECCADALRVRLDPDRNRLWVLGVDRVELYDAAGEKLVRRIPLPDRFVADVVCTPDLALDRSGGVLISDNIQPRLWRIDSGDFALTEHPLRLVGKEHWDIGFGALLFASKDRLLGVTASGGALWSIDIGSGTARQVELDALVPDACPLLSPAAAQTRDDVAVCAGLGAQSRRIELSPDLARGRVVDEPCDTP